MTWTFLTNHTQVLICLALACDAEVQAAITTRSIAQQLDITERAVQRIIDDLATPGYVAARHEGQRNVYTLRRERPLRSPLAPGHTMGELLAVFAPEPRRCADET